MNRRAVKQFPDDEAQLALGLVFNFAKGKWVAPTAYKKVLRKDPCVYCGSPHTAGRDHIKPASRGGSDGWSNRAPACKLCDKGKGSGQLLRFLIKDKGRWQRLKEYTKGAWHV